MRKELSGHYRFRFAQESTKSREEELMAILISQSRLRELLEEAYAEGRDDARVVRPHQESDWRTATIEQLIEKAMQEDQRCVG